MLYLFHHIFLSICYSFLSLIFDSKGFIKTVVLHCFFFYMKRDVKYFMYIYIYIFKSASLQKKKCSQLFSIFKGKLKSTEIVVQFLRVRLRYQC